MSGESHTPVTFSREEVGEIRVMLNNWDKPPVCPRCESQLRTEEPEVEELKGRVYVKCESCNRTAFVSREPPNRSFDLS
ncbi:MAG: hypothetical protein JSW51_04385 [Gemmatimonadota bacterium]|nr:MAG: hypothetical protein JSW51_04385 [Gemmatimonadota bacterium]